MLPLDKRIHRIWDRRPQMIHMKLVHCSRKPRWAAKLPGSNSSYHKLTTQLLMNHSLNLSGWPCPPCPPIQGCQRTTSQVYCNITTKQCMTPNLYINVIIKYGLRDYYNADDIYTCHLNCICCSTLSSHHCKCQKVLITLLESEKRQPTMLLAHLQSIKSARMINLI